MKVIYIHKEEVHKRPPVLSALTHMASLGYFVELITCGVNDSVKNRLEDMGLVLHVLPYCGAKGRLGKVREYIEFRKDVYRILDNVYEKDSVLWIEAGATIVALGKKIRKYKYVLQIQELHYQEKITMRAMSNVAPYAEAICMPEYNRAVLYQIWFQLKKRPYILPNIPAFFATNEQIEKYTTKYQNFIASIKDKRIIIYQGYVAMERPLNSYLKAVKELGDRYQVVLVGKDCGALKQYREILPNIIHIDYLPSPEYLFFTQHAHIGIVTYDPMDLNNAYCAPNKIFEYANYGLPCLGNDIPGLKFLIEPFNSGKIVDEQDVNSIKDAILEIDSHYEEYSKNAQRMLTSYDNRATIDRILKSIEFE